MQHGSLTTRPRLEGPDVWQFRWSEKGPDGKRIYRKRVIGTIDEYSNVLCRLLEPMDLANWGKHELRNVRTIGFESWLLRLPLEKSSCANSRGVMSVLFNHACRYEFFDRNPIRLLRQGAKRKAAPNILTPDEIKTLMDGLATRERTLVLLAASTGLRQCELFGLKWIDVSFADRSINVTWSMVCGVVGPCKTESSQKPVPVHPLLIETLLKWKEQQT